MVDPEEVAERPTRIRALLEANSELRVLELAREYKRLYDVVLDNTTVHGALRSLGIYRELGPDPDKLAARPRRLKALVKKYHRMTHAQLAHEYVSRYGRKHTASLIGKALKRLGMDRQHSPDEYERKRRQEMFQQLLKENPRITLKELAEQYQEKWGVSLTREQVRKATLGAGKHRYRIHKRQEIELRKTRLRKLYEKYPTYTTEALAAKYQKTYGEAISPNVVKLALTRQGIKRYRFRAPRPVGPAELQKRPRRLETLLAQHPRWSYRQLGEEYERLYGIKLHEVIVRRTLMKRAGVAARRPRVRKND